MTTSPLQHAFDVIIVGAGSAGCVVASRLSADPHRRVLLLEAGPDLGTEEPPDVLSSYPLAAANPNYIWPDRRVRINDGDRPRWTNVPDGRLLGGGSAVNAMLSLRGVAEDYDGWAAGGALGWDWQSVLPFFRKLETDTDFPDGNHGQDGPIMLGRALNAAERPLSRALAEYCRERGLPAVDDANANFQDGYFLTPLATDMVGRVSAGRAYLTPAVRRRPNLVIWPDTTCHRVLFEGKSAIGVTGERGGLPFTVHARSTVLSCGALQSPALLQRSGVGDGEHLGKLGVQTIHHLPGVGGNLQNHCVIPLGMQLRNRGSLTPDRSAACLSLRMSSQPVGGPRGDLYLSLWDRAAWHVFGASIGVLNVVLHKPYSTGRVQIAKANPHQPADVDFNALADVRDIGRLHQGVRFALDMLTHPAFGKAISGYGLLRMTGVARSLMMRTPQNRALNALLKILVPMAPLVERRLQDLVLKPIPQPMHEHELSEALAQAMREAVLLQYHQVGTCAMGPADRALAVTDTVGRVQGVDGLRVVDASIMPTVPRGNSNLPVMMVAEKISAAMIADDQSMFSR